MWNELSEEDTKDLVKVRGALTVVFSLAPAEAYEPFTHWCLWIDESVDAYSADLKRLWTLSGHTIEADGKDQVLLVEQSIAGLSKVFSEKCR